MKSRDYFLALYEVAKVINASLDPSKVLEEVVRSVASAMNVKACSIRLLDSREEQLSLVAAWGLSEDYLNKGPILIRESGLDRKVLLGDSVWLRDVRTDRNFQYGARAKEEGIRSVQLGNTMLYSSLVGDRAMGVLRVYTGRVRKFEEEEVCFLEAVANLSAIALDNARMHKTLQIRCDLMLEHKYRMDDH
jgi:signal transduction protein with GAF and PtsI domain